MKRFSHSPKKGVGKRVFKTTTTSIGHWNHNYYNNHHYYNHPITTTHYRRSWLDVFFVLLLIGFLVSIIILAANANNYYYYHHDPHAKNSFSFLEKHGIRENPMECKTGELWNATLRMCAPQTMLPIAVNRNLMDLTKSACDDFYSHSCGTWLKEHKNENYAFSFVYKKNKKLLHDIVMNKENKEIHNFYQSCVNTLVREEPHSLQETSFEQTHLMQKIMGNNIRHHSDLPVVFGRLARAGFTTPFSFSMEQHPQEPILLPLITWDGFSDIQDTNQISQIFQAKGYAPWVADKRAQMVYGIVEKLNEKKQEQELNANNFVEYVKNGHFSQDLTTFGDLPNWPSYNENKRGWDIYLDKLGGKVMVPHNHPVWLLDRLYLEWLMREGLSSFSMDEWRFFVEFSILFNTHKYAPQLPSNVYFREHMYFAPRDRKHKPHLLKRSNEELSPEHCVRITQYMVPGLVAQKYLLDYFPQGEETRERVMGVVGEMLETYSQMIRNTTWMDKETKEANIQKIESIIPRVVHPNTWEPEPFGPRISKDRWLHNMDMVRTYRVERNMEMWNSRDGSYNRDEVANFGAPLSTCNAFYAPQSNSITIFQGILTPPFYDPKFSRESLMARVGTIIGKPKF